MALIELYTGPRKAYDVSDGSLIPLSTRAVASMAPGVDLVVVTRVGILFYDLPLELLDNLLPTKTLREVASGL